MMDINLTGQIWGMPINFAGQIAEETSLLSNASDFINTLLGVLVGAFLAYQSNRYFEGKRLDRENLSKRTQSYLTFIDFMHSINLKYRDEIKKKGALDDDDIKILSKNINELMIYGSDNVISSILTYRIYEAIGDSAIEDYFSYKAKPEPITITAETLKVVNEYIFKVVLEEAEDFWHIWKDKDKSWWQFWK